MLLTGTTDAANAVLAYSAGDTISSAADTAAMADTAANTADGVDAAVNAANTAANTPTNPFLTTLDEVLRPKDAYNYLMQFPTKALNIGLRVILAIIVFIVGLQIIRLIRFLLKKFTSKLKVERGVKTFLDSFIKAALYVVLIMFTATYFGLDAVGIGAILASAGVTIGLALQGTLSNLAGGVLILLTNPFGVGDYIVDSSSGKEGTVDEIKICYTKLKTFDNQMITLPNGNLANSAVTNVTKEKTRRIDINISIAYSASIDDAREAIMKVMKNDASILADKERRVLVTNLGESAIELDVRFWTKTEDYWDTKFRMNENCKIALDKAGVQIPFPQMDVHIIEK